MKIYTEKSCGGEKETTGFVKIYQNNVICIKITEKSQKNLVKT